MMSPYKVIRLSQLPGQAVLDSGTVGLLPFAPLMQPPAGQAEATWLEQCVARAAALPLDRPVKADFLAGLAILSGLVYNPQTIMAIVSKEHLMDLIRESSFAQYLAESAREEGIEQGKGSKKASKKCWLCAFSRRICTRWPAALGPLTMCSASSSCFGRPSRCPVSKPSGTC